MIGGTPGSRAAGERRKGIPEVYYLLVFADSSKSASRGRAAAAAHSVNDGHEVAISPL